MAALGHRSMRTIEHRLRGIIEDQLDIPPDRIRLDSRFIEDFGADSLDAVELAMAVEEEFNINIPDDMLPHLVTVADVIRYAETHSYELELAIRA
jgi:acyl carrier protein